jgi:hypothetical protein
MGYAIAVAAGVVQMGSLVSGKVKVAPFPDPRYSHQICEDAGEA